MLDSSLPIVLDQAPTQLLWKVVVSQGIRAASTTPRQGAWFRPLVVEIQQRIVLDVPEAALRYRNLGPAPAVW